MAAQDIITPEEIKRLFHYCENIGIFTRIVATGTRAKCGAVVGSADLYGYKTVRIYNKSYKLHRLAWLYVHGHWPIGDVDHINGNRSDNRICNLRDVSRATNLQNQRAAPNNRSTGMLGVYPSKNRERFYSKISMGNKSINLGTFDTADEASTAYITAKRKLHEGCMI